MEVLLAALIPSSCFLSQVVIDTDKSSFTLRFESRDHLNHVVGHINLALSRIFNNSIFA